MIDMSVSIALLVAVVVLVSVGLYLVMERSLSRIVIGTCLITHGINLAILIAGGKAGGAPILGLTSPDKMSDPLPQAMVLTAIVIGMAISAFLLAMAYRSWQLNNHDEVQDDLEDRLITLNAKQRLLDERVEDDDGSSLENDAESTRDETDQGPQKHWLSSGDGR